MIATILVQAMLILAVLTIPVLALWQDRKYTRRPDPMRWDVDDE